MLSAAIRTARSFTGRLADVEVVGDGSCPHWSSAFTRTAVVPVTAVPENVRFGGLKCSHDGRFVPSVFFAL
jgi:hypothetical protein